MTSAIWIEWSGGECPVPLDAVVQAKFRNGTKHTEQANWWAGGMGVNNWKHSAAYPLADIVAYRVVEPKARARRLKAETPTPVRLNSTSLKEG